jgi:hypothetical protein
MIRGGVKTIFTRFKLTDQHPAMVTQAACVLKYRRPGKILLKLIQAKSYDNW